MAQVSISLLGGFAAAVDGSPVEEKAWRLKKARELVKLLALAQGHRLHREQAMDVLWHDRAPGAAANNLHQAVHVARRVLDAGAIELRDEVLYLVAEIDVERFDLAATDARRIGSAAAYQAALSLYGGELLPENRYDDWAEARREELAALAAELATELEALGPGAAARSTLPAETSSFVGRGRELIELKALLRHTRLLTLSGAGGAGKTRLALELARSAEPAFEDGAALVEFAAIADASLVLDAVAVALDVRALSGQELVDAVIDLLAPRRLLLLLDNCEHVLTETLALADALLRSAPQLTIIATSREPLRIQGEVVFRVPSLDIPDPEHALPPDELLRYEAVSLFVERAVAAAPGFVLDDENCEDIARICFRLDGLPLALELAAGRLGALSPAAIAERLDDRFRLLRTGSHVAPTRQQTLAATLQWSHDLLVPDERILFRRLAVFAGGFELEAVEKVCVDEELGAEEIADLLGRLAEKSLVAVDDAGGDRRYRLLETVRLYARERLAEAGEATTVAERHAGWALELAEQHRNSARLDRDGANLRAALEWLLEHEPDDALRLCVALLPFWLRRIDLHSAKRRFEDALAAAGGRPTTLRAEALLAAAAIEYRSGTLAHGVELAEESLAVAADVGDTRLEWRALQFVGEFGVASDITDTAVRGLERALVFARSNGFEAGEALGIYSLGVAQWNLGDLARADDLITQSVEVFRALEGSSERIPSLLNIADFRSSRQEGPLIRLVFEDTLQPFAEISCDAAVSYALANQSGIARLRGDLGRAHALLDESASRFEAADEDAGRAMVLVRRAYIEHDEGELAAAYAHLEEALELRRGQRDRRGLGLTLSGLGLVATTAGDYPRAERHLGEAREIFRRAGDRWGLASSLWRTADLALALGDLDGAEAALQEARVVLGPTQRERWIANTIAGLAEVALHRGDVEQATALLIDARERYAARDDAPGVAHVEERLRIVAKPPLRPGKGAPDRTSRTTTTKGRKS